MSNKTKRDPYLWEAIIPFLAIIISISLAIVFFGSEPHIALFIGTIVASIIALNCGYKWQEIEDGMKQGIHNSLQAVIILMIIGIIIGIWISAGVVPTMIYYGLKILSPTYFLVATAIICAITSLGTGSSWTTVGTVGIAMMAIGQGLGIPLPVVAGSIISGAWFGDKVSPLSDTTNLAPAMAGAKLYDHIKHMLYTTSVGFGITLVIFTVLGFKYGGGAADMGQVSTLLQGLSGSFNINLLLLLPPIIVIALAVKKVPAIPALTIGAILGALFGIVFQGIGFGDILNAGYGGYVANTGMDAVDSLLSNGGVSSMMYSISIILLAMMFGGVMEETNQLKIIVTSLLRKLKSDNSLVATTVLTGIFMNIALADEYMSIVITGRTYAQAYKDRGLKAKNLSRALEDGATQTCALIPWNTNGAYVAGTLGVATFAYLPFCFFNWITPIVSIIFALLGITIEHEDDYVAEDDNQKLA
ncbi:Na+/H+ antiporter NhaC [Halanaerobium sp.]|uniref:Na+/H+ antiporter NhaC n=1 Tax=Halanaerobium sp. TaxID=1895664 RepID=UPI000DE7513D|nr:Na+/H+ antiporter NhaC [Halanaerobium sp.]PUU91390.1 MAG: Na+:H+ antiporter, NhaC family [Halanaerobium sp.]